MSNQRKLSIYVSGAHSVGKTTLQEALLKNEEFSKFGFKGQNEIARRWVKQKGYTQQMLQDPKSFMQLQRELLDQQVSKEASEISDYGDRYHRFFWDRGVLDPIIYVKVYYGLEIAEEIVSLPKIDAALSRLKNKQDVLVLVPKPYEDFLDFDGVRVESNMEQIMRIHNTMISTLNDLGIYHKVINVYELSDRVKVVIEEVKRKWPWLANV